MHCGKCGIELENGVKFCPKCGEKVDWDDLKNETQIMKSAQNMSEKSLILNNMKEWWEKNKVKFCLIVGMIAVLLIGIGIFNAVYNSNISKFKRAFQKSDYAQASNIYSSKLSYDESAKDEAYAVLQDKIADVQEKYISEEIEYETAKKSLDDLTTYHLAEDEAMQAQQAINELCASRQAFDEGMAYMEQQKYELTISALDKVITEDPDYAQAQKIRKEALEQCKKQVVEQAEQALSEENYEGALSSLEQVKSILGKDTDIIQLTVKIQDTQIKAEKKELLEEAKKLDESGNDLEAYQLLSETTTLSNDADISQAMNQYKDAYVNQVMDEAYQKLEENSLSAAVSALNVGLNNVPGEKQMLDLRNECDNCRAVKLTDLDFFAESGKTNRWETVGIGKFTDNLENSDYEGIKISFCDKYDSSRTYLINSNYNVISGILAISNKSKEEKYKKVNARLVVEGDGNVLYSSALLSGGVKPFPFSVDISGVNELTVRFEGNGLGWSTTTFGIMNCELSKKLPSR